MCGCEQNINLSSTKIYTIMEDYKVIKHGSLLKNGFSINTSTATQEELAYAYEVLNLTDYIEKVSKTKSKDDSKKSKKSSTNKK
tara:strand:+ start:783 stop:1034 length:252 start_codon:yes stop_codon:yes gene_type:complete